MTMEFKGFPNAGIQYLFDLDANNNRDWFTANKTTLENQLLEPARLLCEQLESYLGTLTGATYASKVYRMHRDLRFSADKTPYNTHLHITFLGPPDACAWHLGIDTKKVSVGAGVFRFSEQRLRAFRALVSQSGPTISENLAQLVSNGARLEEPELKRVPKEYPADQPFSDLFRRKGLTAWIDLGAASEATAPDFARRCEESFRALMSISLVVSPI
ncbi:DUF2461 domain-containing protein [Devosia sp. CAU 1758]